MLLAFALVPAVLLLGLGVFLVRKLFSKRRGPRHGDIAAVGLQAALQELVDAGEIEIRYDSEIGDDRIYAVDRGASPSFVVRPRRPRRKRPVSQGPRFYRRRHPRMAGK